MTWSLKKPEIQFSPGTKVKFSATSPYQEENAQIFGNGPFTVAYSYIAKGGANSQADEGVWWGGEKISITSNINGEEYVASQLTHRPASVYQGM